MKLDRPLGGDDKSVEVPDPKNDILVDTAGTKIVDGEHAHVVPDGKDFSRTVPEPTEIGVVNGDLYNEVIWW